MEEKKPENPEQAQQNPQDQQDQEMPGGSKEDKLHRQISETEKLEAILTVLKGKRPVEDVCRELNVSKEGFYKWMRLGMEGMKDALKPVGRGRKSIYTPQERAQMKELQKQNKKLEKEKTHLETLYRIAQTLIEWQREEEEKEKERKASKKKDDSAKN